MKVIFGQENAKAVSDRMTLLELDTFKYKEDDGTVTAYAVVDAETLPVNEIPVLSNHADLHNTMMLEYRRRNWDYCEQALEHLTGKWKGSIDSFYKDFRGRIDQLKNEELSDDWNGVIDKTAEN